jgi:hypothetical protein
LTPGGIAAAEAALGAGLNAMATLFDGLSRKDPQHYLKVLGQLLDAMNSPPVPAAEALS